MTAVTWLDEPATSPVVEHNRPLAIPLLALTLLALFSAWYLLAGPGTDTPATSTGVTTAIEVRPFVDRSPGKDQQHIADGFADELANKLSDVAGLHVNGPRSPANPEAEYLLHGSVQHFGGELRIAAQLDDADSGVRIWSHTFARPYEEFFEIQGEIAAAVATALSIELELADPKLQADGTSNIHAFEQVILGDSFYDFTQQGMAQAIRHYRRAAELDPLYATAWQRIAMFHNEIHITEGLAARQKNAELANHAIDMALSIAPRSEGVLITAADIAFNQRRWIEGRRLLDQAEQLRDEPINQLLGRGGLWSAHLHFLNKLGYTTAALELLENVHRRGDLDMALSGFLAHAYLSAARYDNALAVCELAYEQAPVLGPPSDLGLLVALSMRDDDLIRLWLDRLVAIEWPATGGAYSAMQERLDDRDNALIWLRDAYAAGPENDYWVTIWASYYGDDELALKAMRRTADLWAFWLPLTAGARSSTEFQRLVADIGLVDYWREYGWNDYCRPTENGGFACL